MKGSILGLALAGIFAPNQAPSRAPSQGVVVDGPAVWSEIAIEDPALVDGYPTARLQLQPKADGIVTISAGSYDFDVFLRIETEAGDNLRDDDNGGVETNARLAVPLRGKRTYNVFVANKSSRPGRFWVDCRSGEQAPRSREMELDGAVLFYGASAGEAQAKGDLTTAAAFLEKKGAFLRQRPDLAKAEEAWSSARALWEQSKMKSREAGATLELGRLAAARANAAGAEERFAQALAIYRAIPEAAGEARTLLAIAEARVNGGDLDAGTTRYGEALAVAKRIGDTECQALALTGLVGVHRAKGDRRAEREAAEALGDLWREALEYEKARASHQLALEIARETGDAASEGRAWADLGLDWHLARQDTHARECFEKALPRAEAFDGLGKVAFGMGDYRAALRFHEQQLEAAGKDPVQACQAQLRIGICLLAMEDYPRARSALESALAKAQAAHRNLEEADALDGLATVGQKTGRPEESTAYQLRAMQLRSGPESSKLRMAFEEAENLFQSGQIAPARAAFEQCLEQEGSNSDRWCRMVALLRLGECLERQGRFAAAIRSSSEALALARILGARRLEIEAHERLALQSRIVGALDTALEHVEAGLEIAREIGDLGQELDAMIEAGNVYLELHQTEKVVECNEQVAVLGRRLGFPIAEALSLNNIGVAYWGDGLYEKSLPLLEQAVAAATELRAPSDLANSQGNLARTLLKLGDRDRAKDLATQSLRAMEAREASGSTQSRMLLIPLQALTAIAIADKDVDGARLLLERAAVVLEGIRLEAQAAPGDLGANPWPPCLRLDRYGQDFVRLLEQSASAPAERARILADGFRQADRARARQLSSGMIEHRRGTRSKDTLEFRGKWKQSLAAWQAAQIELSLAVRERRPSEEVDRLEQEVAARREAADEAGLLLADLSALDAALDQPEGVDPVAVRRAAIRKDTAVIEYAEGDDGLYAYVLTEANLARVDLGARAPIDDGIRRYLEILTRPTSNAAEIGKAGNEVYELLLAAPLAVAGEGIERLLIVPTPSLSVLPFDALVVSPKPSPGGFGDLDFVIDRFEVDYCPSASILVTLCDAGPREYEGKMLVLADPVYPSESAAIESSAPRPAASTSALLGTRRGTDGKEFQRLANTREEALALAGVLVDSSETEALARLAQLHKDRGGSLHAKKLDMHLGHEATAAALGGDLRPYSVLHLAAHGSVDGLYPQNTGIALTWAGSGPYRGLFTIADVGALDLDADLVVLSACDTARGKVLAGEGVESMAWAFLLAGSRSVVASLWQIYDQWAAETMKSFYAGILEGKPWGASLRDAKLAIRRGSTSRGLSIGKSGGGNEAHPAAWAPFIFIGAPR